MRGKAQPDGRPAVELIETPVLRFASFGPNYPTAINDILLQYKPKYTKFLANFRILIAKNCWGHTHSWDDMR